MVEIIDELEKYKNSLSEEVTLFSNEKLREEEKEYVRKNGLAFFIGLVADQSVKEEIAWALPYKLKERLGHFDIEKLSDPSQLKTIEKAIKKKPSLHRYPSSIASFINQGTKLIVDKYDGVPSNIWKSLDVKKTVDNLLEFKGIGEKKAALGIILLSTDFELEFSNYKNLDIAVDVHIRRIVPRLGLTKTNRTSDIIEQFRIFLPDYPGKYSKVLWSLGREYCKPKNPHCNECPMNKSCKKLI